MTLVLPVEILALFVNMARITTLNWLLNTIARSRKHRQATFKAELCIRKSSAINILSLFAKYSWVQELQIDNLSQPIDTFGWRVPLGWINCSDLIAVPISRNTPASTRLESGCPSWNYLFHWSLDAWSLWVISFDQFWKVGWFVDEGRYRFYNPRSDRQCSDAKRKWTYIYIHKINKVIAFSWKNWT